MCFKMLITIQKIVFVLFVLVHAINLASVELQVGVTVATNRSQNTSELQLENGNDTLITLEDVENNSTSIELDFSANRTRSKRCLHNIFARLLQRICHGCQNQQMVNGYRKSDWARYERELRQREKQAQVRLQAQSTYQVAVGSDRDEGADESNVNNENSEENGNDNQELDSDEDDEIDEEEEELVNGLKEWEHEYDAQLQLELKNAEESGDSAHRKTLIKLSKNTQYLGLKQKILSTKNQKKRVRLLKRLTKSFKNVIEVQKKISATKKGKNLKKISSKKQRLRKKS